MKKERLYKCYGDKCNDNNIKWPLSKLTKESGKNYCDDCYMEMIKDRDGRQTLYGIIQQVYEIPFPNGLMLRQIKEYRKDRTYEYEDMAKAILYAKHVLHKNMETKYGLGLVPYVIEDAKKFYIDQKEKMKNMEGKTVQSEKVTVNKKYKQKENHLRSKKIIDMENIL